MPIYNITVHENRLWYYIVLPTQDLNTDCDGGREFCHQAFVCHLHHQVVLRCRLSVKTGATGHYEARVVQNKETGISRILNEKKNC